MDERQPEAPRRRRVAILLGVGAVLILAATAWWGLGLRHYFGEVSHTRQTMAKTEMKADLRNLASAQEAYFLQHVTYSAGIPDSFRSSADVTVTIGTATTTGWSATARHRRLDEICGIFVGSASSPVAGGNEGEPRCQ